MTIFRVRHITSYRYRRPVGFGRHQLMFEAMVGQTGFADGDLEGLRRVGSGPCFSR